MTPGYFFQAEDGIRDRTVTGVQTCALPISGTVEAGSMTVRVPLSALRPDAITAGTGAEPRRQNGASTGRSPRPDDERSANQEPMLIGRRTDEASNLLEKYLDDAFLAGLPTRRF